MSNCSDSASEVVGEGDEVTGIADGCGCDWSVNVRANEFERPRGVVFVGDKGVAKGDRSRTFSATIRSSCPIESRSSSSFISCTYSQKE
jgi:hypothetical protein